MIRKTLILLIISSYLFGCNNEPKETPKEQSVAEVKTNSPEQGLSESKKDSLTKLYDQNRLTVEGKINDITAVEITSEYFRENVRQKWKKIHVYADENAIVRIKSYPYETITDRTEEFYFHEGRLAMVVMENDGEWTQFEPKETLDKIFYFHDGILFNERGDESPYESWEKMGSELTQEAVEYTKLYEEALLRAKKEE